MSKFACFYAQISMLSCPNFIAVTFRLSCFPNWTYLRSCPDLHLFMYRFLCVHILNFLRSSDICALMSIPSGLYVQTFVLSCSDLLTFLYSLDFRDFSAFFNGSRLCNFLFFFRRPRWWSQTKKSSSVMRRSFSCRTSTRCPKKHRFVWNCSSTFPIYSTDKKFKWRFLFILLIENFCLIETAIWIKYNCLTVQTKKVAWICSSLGVWTRFLSLCRMIS